LLLGVVNVTTLAEQSIVLLMNVCVAASHCLYLGRLYIKLRNISVDSHGSVVGCDTVLIGSLTPTFQSIVLFPFSGRQTLFLFLMNSAPAWTEFFRNVDIILWTYMVLEPTGLVRTMPDMEGRKPLLQLIL
jgi:hypothetical protein